MFLEDGQIFREVDRDGGEQVFDARPGDISEDMPIVVLVNGASASGSEVFAAALQQNDRATLIGETTFGKGTVNILRELGDGGGLYVSIAQWFTPDGERIDTLGVEPDIEFCRSDEDIDEFRDSQLQAAIDYLQGEDVEAQECVTPAEEQASEESDESDVPEGTDADQPTPEEQ